MISSKRSFEEAQAPAAAAAAAPAAQPVAKRCCSSSSSSSNSESKKKSAERRCLHPYDGWRTNDEIHSTIYACPVAGALIGTPALQRMRGIKQLGTSEMVYINVNHNRLEHSIGVMHLAERLCRQIQIKQPNLKVSEKSVLCVKLAGLLHDVGHGPWSHVYELFVMDLLPKYRKENPHLEHFYQNVPDMPEGWQHESVSLMMIDCALEHLGLAIDLDNLDGPLKEIGGNDPVDARTMRVFGEESEEEDGSHHTDGDDMSMILTSRDFVFIKECIYGKPIPEVRKKLGRDEFIGRPDPCHEWLYDIVCNRHSGLDVDKIDYFARDQRRANREAGEIEKLMIDDAVVTWAKCTQEPGGKCVRCNEQYNRRGVGKHLMICYPEKSYLRCLTFFKTRYKLHQNIYRHKTVSATAFLICDILCKADPYFRIPTCIQDGRKSGKAKREFESLPISRAMLDPVAFLQLTDSIFDVICFANDDRLNEAKQLIWQYKARQLYKCSVDQSIAMNKPTESQVWKMTDQEIEDEMLMIARDGKHKDKYEVDVTVQKGDFVVEHCNMHYGCKDQNPLNSMRFVAKAKLPHLTRPSIDKLPMAEKIDEESFGEADLPRGYQKCSIRAYSRDTSKDKAGLVAHIFSQFWCNATRDGVEATPHPLDSGNVGAEQQYDENQPPVPLSQDSGDENDDYGEEEDEDDRPVMGNGDDGMLAVDFASPKPHNGADGHTPNITPPRHAALTKKNVFPSS